MRRPLALRLSPEHSFETFYRRHAPDVYRYALALLASPADAEEVTQTTFLNAHRAIQRGEHPQHPRAWLHAIALNLCRQRFRQAERRPSEVPLVDDDVAEVVPDDDAPTLDDLTRALKHLPFNQRAALVMREFEGRSPAQIAEALEVTPSAVETLLFRARRALREQLEGSLTCQDAERGVSLQLDGLLARADRGPLRAHLRECAECASLARSMRAQSGSMKSLAVLPVPSTLARASGAGSAGAGAGIAGGTSLLGSLAAKFVVGSIAATALAGTTYESVTHAPSRAPKSEPAARAAPAATRTPAVARVVSAGAAADARRMRAAAGAAAWRSAHATAAASRAGAKHAGSTGAGRAVPVGASTGRDGSGSQAGRGEPVTSRPARRVPGSVEPAAARRKPGTRPSRPKAARGRSGAVRPAGARGPKATSAKAKPTRSKPAAPARSKPAARTPPASPPVRTPPATEPHGAPLQQAPAPGAAKAPKALGGG